MTPLQDTDKMPWGKFKNTPMQDVPADYFHWLWTGENNPSPLKHKVKVCPVADYIQRNMLALQEEYEDGIW